MGHIGMHAYMYILFMREPNENKATHFTTKRQANGAVTRVQKQPPPTTAQVERSGLCEHWVRPRDEQQLGSAQAVPGGRDEPPLT